MLILISVRDVETNVVKRLQVKQSLTITELKERLESLFGTNSVQSMMFQGIDLRHGTLRSNGIEEGCLIDIMGEIVGGGGFRFADMNSVIRRKFSSSSPAWRIVRPGFSFRGICNNSRCEAYGKEVIINQGYGVYVIRDRIREAACPICIRIARAVENCGFYKAKWRFWGRYPLNDSNQQGSGEADTEDYTTFEEVYTSEWSELIIEVKPLR